MSSPACPLAEPVTLLSVCLSRSGAPVEEAAPRTGPPALRLGRVGGGLPSWGVAICEGLSPKCPQLVGCWPFHPLMTRLLTARDVRAGVLQVVLGSQARAWCPVDRVHSRDCRALCQCSSLEVGSVWTLARGGAVLGGGSVPQVAPLPRLVSSPPPPPPPPLSAKVSVWPSCCCYVSFSVVSNSL